MKRRRSRLGTMNLLLAKTAAVVAAAFVAARRRAKATSGLFWIGMRRGTSGSRHSASHSHSRIQITENKEKNQGPTKRARLLNIIDKIYVVWIKTLTTYNIRRMMMEMETRAKLPKPQVHNEGKGGSARGIPRGRNMRKKKRKPGSWPPGNGSRTRR